MTTPYSSERGSSLIEIVVASAIFAFLVLSLSPSLLTTRKAAALSGNSSAATTLALDKLEQLRSLASTHADMTGGTHNDSTNPMGANGTSGGIFTRSWVVTNNTPVLGMKRVEMRVSWRDRSGTNTVNLVTLVLP